MQIRLAAIWDRITASFWCVPILINVIALLSAIGVILLDLSLSDPLHSTMDGLFVFNSESGARSILGVIATSMITVAGVVFSITMVVLVMASQQFGPRLLRTFMQDRIFQVTLGAFLAPFVYCLTVLYVHGLLNEKYMNLRITILLAYILAMLGVILIIIFIHHLSVSIHATNVIKAVSNEMHKRFDEFFESENAVNRPYQTSDEGRQPTAEESRDLDNIEISQNAPASGWELNEQEVTLLFGDNISTHFSPAPNWLSVNQTGYLQAINFQHLLEIAEEQNFCIVLPIPVGAFVTRGSPILGILSTVEISAQLKNEMMSTYVCSSSRSPTQDIEFCIDQLVEIALRALSPGINAPFTALTCIEYLSAGLSKLVQQPLASHIIRDSEGSIRLLRWQNTEARLINRAYGQIRQSAADMSPIYSRLLAALGNVAHFANERSYRAAIKGEADLILEAAKLKILLKEDLDTIQHEYDQTIMAIARPQSMKEDDKEQS